MWFIKKMRNAFTLTLVFILFAGTNAISKETIRFVSVSWTGVTVKTELGVLILKSLGYDASNIMVSVPIAYKAMETKDADIFLGYWYPSMTTIAEKYFKKGTVVNFIANMPGAKYTLAAPSYVVDGGLKNFSQLTKYGEKLDWKIYGIEEGNDGNQIIQEMIDKNMFGMKKFELIPSSEAGMLSQVQSFVKKKKWIVFLGWKPHYMNEIIDMKYLSGSNGETFGENDGSATVYTNIRKGFDTEHPNIAVFLRNFTFPVSMMNQIMDRLHKDQSLSPLQAGISWVKEHPEIYKKWLTGVKTRDGASGLKAFESYLGSLR